MIIGCVWQTLAATLRYQASTYIWSSLLASTIITICIGWIFFYGYAAIISWSAKTLGGKGDIKSTYRVLIWSFAPGIIVIIAYTLAVALFGANVIKSNTAIGNLYVVRTMLLFLNALMGVWFLFIFIKGIMYTHQLSFFKTMLVLFFPVSIFLVLTFL